LEFKAQLALQERRVLQVILVEQEPRVSPARLVCKEPQETSELLELPESPEQQEFKVLLEKDRLELQVLEPLVFRVLLAILALQALLD
jgi:hypothetical protein